ncbi:MAG: NusG domain II-containing protein [Collinsella sp.]
MNQNDQDRYDRLGTNLIEIKDGRVHVEEADCPNQDCVHQGWVDAAEEQIVCLPHKHRRYRRRAPGHLRRGGR